MDEVSNGRKAALVALVVATAVALVWSFWPHSDSSPAVAKVPPAQTVVQGAVFKPSQCGTPASKPFTPTRISIAHVAHDAEVLALGRDGNNVPGAPALSSQGKTQFGWDDPSKANPGIHDLIKPPGAMPGSKQGNVLMNAHTWPDGSALGNRLLEHLQVGGRIILEGKGSQLCYQVTKRIVIKASDGSTEYYQQDGPAQIALIVCSPPRLGPGNWENRTIWFASPVPA